MNPLDPFPARSGHRTRQTLEFRDDLYEKARSRQIIQGLALRRHSARIKAGGNRKAG
jgi:hypothetical protein